MLFATVIAAEALVSYAGYPDPFKEPDVILILGCGVDLDHPIVQDRARNGVNAIELYPNAKVILTGNNLYNENDNTLHWMKIYGYTGSPLRDDHSVSTWTNITNSKMLISNNESNVLIVTSQFHQSRATAIAKTHGLRARAFGIDFHTYSDRYFHFFRERLGNMKFMLQWMLYQLGYDYEPRVHLNSKPSS